MADRVEIRAAELYRGRLAEIARRTDRMFAWLMAAQWLFAVVLAVLVSPRAWAGLESRVHFHVQAAAALGGLIASLPIFLALKRPTEASTRHVIAIGQMMFSALLIHLTGGRIETHFHVFGSLAFLAFYRDWTVLATATVVVALDHGLRGVLWPESVYGVSSMQTLRFLEHTAWVVFEDAFLCYSLAHGLRDMRDLARRQAQLEETNRDIERKVKERTEELARSNAELEQFAYAASHDLQEPLRKVTNFTQLLARQYEGRLDAEADMLINRVTGSAIRMSGMIAALLQLSRVGYGGANHHEVDLAEVLRNVLADLDLNIRESGAVVTSGPLPVVLGNRAQLAQLLQNLVANGVKFRGLERPRVHVSAERRGGLWEVKVQDNGIGIDPRHLGKLFVMFRRLHTRDQYPGHGIGLALARKVVERHGGRIWAESEPGRGAAFLFTLPAAHGRTQDVQPTAQHTAH